jgi:tellurite resistance protein
MPRRHEPSPHTLNGDLGTAIMAGGSVLAATETLKAVNSKHHSGEHMAHAAIGAAAAVGGYELAEKNCMSYIAILFYSLVALGRLH